MKLEIDKSKIKILLIGALVLFAVIFWVKGLFFAAFVNGTPITRFGVIKALEKQGGKRVLDSLVTRELILQEAKKKKVVVNQNEIDKEIKKIEENTSKQGQNLDQILNFQGMTRDDFKNQIEIQLIVEKLLASKIKVSNEEIDDFIRKNTPTEEGSTLKPPTKDEAKEQLRQQKLQQEADTLIQQLKKNAKISYFVNY